MDKISKQLSVFEVNDLTELLDFIEVDAPFFALVEMCVDIVSESSHFGAHVFALVLSVVEIAPA